MRGGSYNYLCYAETLSEILQKKEDLICMRDRLASTEDALDALAETEELIALISGTQRRIEARIKRLAPIWRAVEWVDSGDSLEDSLKNALNAWRNT